MNRLPFFKGLFISLGLSALVWGGVIYVITSSFSADEIHQESLADNDKDNDKSTTLFKKP